ncbi:DUF3050 domain-containing protein [Rubinisphaera italica]|uniref:Heme oxygenase n=1 Tax=Rubinisphaera italica TaxID=2527969 RepID=A0A5C5XI98_9PLAN|nr:DUF3050 domain-containing protein [Rubinisphaera italica]TWT62847.1 hypothetical protein Pan54_35930 [Rubinisphaera italica]
MSRIQHLLTQIAPHRNALINHAVYNHLNNLDAFHTFMEHHVYAVWDFMSLLKSLQNQFACTTVPWHPSSDASACRMINEIVLAEESDEDGRGGFASHFELYCRSMKTCGASVDGIEKFLFNLKHMTLHEALISSDIPQPAVIFIQSTFEIIDSYDPIAITSAFTFGREDLLPNVFQRIVDELNVKTDGRMDEFKYYLERHIGLDGDEHGPMANRLIEQLCQDDEQKWIVVEQAAIKTLVARKQLWDAILSSIVKS